MWCMLYRFYTEKFYSFIQSFIHSFLSASQKSISISNPYTNITKSEREREKKEILSIHIIRMYVRITHPRCFLYLEKKREGKKVEQERRENSCCNKHIYTEQQNKKRNMKKKEILWWRPSIFFSTFWMTGQSRNVPKIYSWNTRDEICSSNRRE